MGMDFSDVKPKQRAMWGMGEYDRIAESLHPVQEHAVRIARVRPGERVLDVATGTGNTAIKAREHGARVSGIDLSPDLLAVARKKAEEEGFGDVDFREADAASLPFTDDAFDVVLSTCGHMFAPDQERVGRELVRVTKPGGRIVYQAWRGDGGVGDFFRLVGRHAPPPPSVPSPFNWSDPTKAKALLGPSVGELRMVRGDAPEVGESPEAVADLFLLNFGPLVAAGAGLDARGRDALRADFLQFLRGYVTPADGKVRWGREYVIASTTKRG